MGRRRMSPLPGRQHAHLPQRTLAWLWYLRWVRGTYSRSGTLRELVSNRWLIASMHGAAALHWHRVCFELLPAASGRAVSLGQYRDLVGLQPDHLLACLAS